MRFAEIKNDKVVNILEAEQSFIDTVMGMYIQSDTAYLDQDYINGVFVVPTPKAIPIALPITDITVTNVRFKVGDVVSFNFTSELTDDNYFIPYRVVGDGRKYLKDVVIFAGKGTITFNFTQGGIYYINSQDLPLTELQINGSSSNRFTIYVAE